MHQSSHPCKVEGPTTSLTFLGINLDTISMEANITEEKKQSLLQELSMLQSQHKCTKRELLSLIGKLSFSCKILPAGQIFLCRLIDLTTTVKHRHHHIKITTNAHLDMRWWLDFLPSWSVNKRATGHLVLRCSCPLVHQALSVGAGIGQVDGFKEDGQKPS